MFRFTGTTSATVGNRLFGFTLADEAGNIVTRRGWGTNLPANVSGSFETQELGVITTSQLPNSYVVGAALPMVNLTVLPNWTLTLEDLNTVSAADTITDITLYTHI